MFTGDDSPCLPPHLLSIHCFAILDLLMFLDRRVKDVLTDRSLLQEWVKTCLIHMDDTNGELQVPRPACLQPVVLLKLMGRERVGCHGGVSGVDMTLDDPAPNLCDFPALRCAGPHFVVFVI